MDKLVKKARQKNRQFLSRGSTIGFAGCGIRLFFVVILEMRANKKNGSGKGEF